MPLDLLRHVRRLSAKTGKAAIQDVIEARGPEGEEILSDCLLRSFIKEVDAGNYVSLTALGIRVTD